MTKVVDLVVDRDTLVGRDAADGPAFLAIRRLLLRNRRDDGSLSPPYVCDFIVRDKGVDAVVVAVFARSGSEVRVLLREGLRPALRFGRAGDPTLPCPDERDYLLLREVVAGIVERGDVGDAGLRRRAAIEVGEEAGFEVAPSELVPLGHTFPSPGAMAERFWLFAVEVNPAAQRSLPGDGSPMEEGAQTTWRTLDEAIAACGTGDIEDAKTELVLRRLRDHLA